MTEIYNSKKCALLEGARELAGKKGLDASKLVCSALNLCTGEFCIYLSPTGDFGPQQLEKFKTRQEKLDELKLQELRRQLKHEGNPLV
jgi:hypothetical protein